MQTNFSRHHVYLVCLKNLLQSGINFYFQTKGALEILRISTWAFSLYKINWIKNDVCVRWMNVQVWKQNWNPFEIAIISKSDNHSLGSPLSRLKPEFSIWIKKKPAYGSILTTVYSIYRGKCGCTRDFE